PRLSSISDAWGRLNVVTPFHHLSGDSHLHRSIGAGPLRHLVGSAVVAKHITTYSSRLAERSQIFVTIQCAFPRSRAAMRYWSRADAIPRLWSHLTGRWDKINQDYLASNGARATRPAALALSADAAIGRARGWRVSRDLSTSLGRNHYRWCVLALWRPSIL